MPPRSLAPILMALTLAACDRPQETPKAEAAPAPMPAATSEIVPDVTVIYTCPDGRNLTVRFHDERADLVLSGQSLSLPQAISASGARYSDDRTTVWNKGLDLLVEEPGKSAITCHESARPNPRY